MKSQWKRLCAQVKVNCLNLAIGDSTRDTPCPSCGTTDGDFSVTRMDDGLLFNCYRASCDFSGFIGSRSNIPSRKKKQFKVRQMEETITAVPPDIVELLGDKYGIDRDVQRANRFGYIPNRDCLWLPIFDIRGYEVGGVARQYHKKYRGIPKTINYWNEDAPSLHFPRQELNFDSLVLVEGTFDAVRVATFCDCAALLGSSLSTTDANFLRNNYKEIKILLDPDATKTAIKTRNKYNLQFDNVEILLLENDPKDSSDEELKEILL